MEEDRRGSGLETGHLAARAAEPWNWTAGRGETVQWKKRLQWGPEGTGGRSLLLLQRQGRRLGLGLSLVSQEGPGQSSRAHTLWVLLVNCGSSPASLDFRCSL